MSVSRHPIALRIERRVGEGWALLATVMGLPLVDGIFPALLLAGAVDDAIGILEVGLLVFGGSATVAVVLADLDGSRRQKVTATLAVGAAIVGLAAVEAALAPAIASALDLATFRRFAALVLLVVAARTASARVADYLPGPGVVVALGLVASVHPATLSVAVVADPMLVVRGAAAACVGAVFAVSVALLGPSLRGHVDLDRFRFGSAVALGVLALSVVGLVPTNAPVPLAVFGLTILLAFDPGGAAETGAADDDRASDGSDVRERDRAPWM